MPTTIQQIAVAAGVNHGTVSSVLNGRGDQRRVGRQTQERILRIAQEQGYLPNPLARGLRGMSTRSAAVLWSWGVPTQAGEAVRQLANRFRARGYTTAAVDCLHRQDIARQALRDCVSRRVDLVVLHVQRGLQDDRESIQLLKRIPAVVLVHQQPLKLGFDTLVSDIDPALARAVDHLLGQGRRSFVALDMAQDPAGKAQRLQRLIKARAPRGVRFRRLPLQRKDEFAPPDWFLDPLRRQLDRGVSFDAAFCFNDVTAMALMNLVQARGLAVPRDVAVVGFGDSESAPFTWPPLASISRQFEQIAREAERLSFARLESPGAPPQTARVAAQFVLRESAGGVNERDRVDHGAAAPRAARGSRRVSHDASAG
jgi:DNA-binding LacI/PurR family transcriptional regulator